MLLVTAIAAELPAASDHRNDRRVPLWAWFGLFAAATAGWILALVGSSAAQPVSFGIPTEFSAGSDPKAIAVGDLNQDEEADLTVASAGSNAISVLLGNGDGSFAAPTQCNVGTTPVSVAIGDFNGDDMPDLVTANADSHDVSILLVTDGACGPAANFPVGDSPYSVAIGDFNLDDKADLATANFFGNSVSILLGDGTGSFYPPPGLPRDRPVGNGAESVAIGDFNRDQKPDLAVANFYSNTVSILLGDGTGDFGPPTQFNAGPGATFVAIGDLNSDDKPDLAVATAYTPSVSVLFGDGQGSFGAPTTVPVLAGPQSVEIGDFNGDDHLDLAVAYTQPNLVSIVPGNGAGAFGPAMHCIIGGTGNSDWDLLATGKYNQDDALDLAVVNSGNETVSILLNTTAPAPPSDLVVAQLSATLSGGNIAISDTEQNIGSNPAGTFTVAFYFASNPTSATSGTLIGTRSVAGLAANGASNTASTWFGIPASIPAGTWFICAVTDAGWAINEVNETNNALCTTQSYTFGPDLTVSSLSASISGTNITITDIERNTGNWAANPSVVAFYFAANPNTPTSGTLIGTRSVPGIAVGAQSNAATLFAIPDATPTGTYYVCAASDSRAAVAEFNEGNNTRCTAGTYVIGPDLIVHALTATKSGGTLSVTDMQRNLGNRRAAAFTVSFYLSVNTVLDAADRFLGSRSVPSLAGGGTVSSNITTLPIPAGTALGRYYVLAISDSGNLVTELNEANNIRATAGTYPIP